MESVRETVLSPAFVDALIKRSPEAEQVYDDCGRIRLQRTVLAAVELYLEQHLDRKTE